MRNHLNVFLKTIYYARAQLQRDENVLIFFIYSYYNKFNDTQRSLKYL